MYSRAFKIAFVRPNQPHNKGTRVMRHRQDLDDGFKTACGIDLLDPDIYFKNGRVHGKQYFTQAEFVIRCKGKEEYVCPKCRRAVKARTIGKGGSRQVLTEAQIWEAARLYHGTDMTLDEVAARYVVAVSSIHKYFKDRGIPRKPKVPREKLKIERRRREYDWREAEDIRYLYNSDNSIETVAKRLGLTPGRLKRKMNLYGIPVRPLDEQKKLAARNRPRGDHLTAEGRERLREAGLRALRERKGLFVHERFDHLYEENYESVAA